MHSVMMCPFMFVCLLVCMWLYTFIPENHAFAHPRYEARTHDGARRPQPATARHARPDWTRELAS
eukprot:6200121-Pleurochrysis_carterae.AAC.1